MPRCSDHVSHRGESAKLWRVARQWARCLSPASSRAGNNVLSSLPRAEREEERSSRPWRATPQTFAPVGSPLDCGSSSYRLPASVDTASVQGKAKAATDFLVHALAPFPYKPRAEGGSRCYRSPRRVSPQVDPSSMTTTRRRVLMSAPAPFTRICIVRVEIIRCISGAGLFQRSPHGSSPPAKIIKNGNVFRLLWGWPRASPLGKYKLRRIVALPLLVYR